MQGFNMGRYVPPDQEGTTSANKLAGKHALGARARKIGQGILTVRFEMPFAIWCSTCPKPTIIGQGVRFNAEKKKVGNYLSTPIFSFRMKHNVCGGSIEIRTDPAKTEYVVTEGAKRRDTGEGKEGDPGEIKILSPEERERLANDAFAALEGKVQDKKQAETDRSRVEDLLKLRERDWSDPYAASRKLRKGFRVERKVREEKEKVSEAIRDRMGLAIGLLEEREEDALQAGLIEYGAMDTKTAIARVQAKPLFQADGRELGKTAVSAKEHSDKPLKRRKRAVEEAAKARKEDLGRELRWNTRAAVDPFLITERNPGRFTAVTTHSIPGIKRRKGVDAEEMPEITPPGPMLASLPMPARMPLVQYESE
ncbi:MAG: hypothetical protein M1829_000545 [Trizodia sp. TS-e1964]|nr:MAG: hypothetical protein M1829_000545 [Trizodia sp. TS-e1964]